MHHLLILSKNESEYQVLIMKENLRDLNISGSRLNSDLNGGELSNIEPFLEKCDLVFGEPDLIKEILPLIQNLKWVQTTWKVLNHCSNPASGKIIC